MKAKKIISFGVLLAFLFSSTAVEAYNALPGSNEINSYLVNVESRTKNEIIKYIQDHPVDFGEKVSYEIEPNYDTDTIGKLSGGYLNNAINSLNCMRYIAGLNEVTLDENYCQLAQAASYVDCALGELTHQPSQPEGVPDDIYEMGLEGASSSNIAMGYGNLARSVVYGYMEDSDSRNIDRVGHRRWCLNPNMEKTGFGQVGSYSAMYAFDGVFPDNRYAVCWPAQNMPLNYFGDSYAWSFSTGEYIEEQSVSVTLKRISDGKVWSFGREKSDGDFYVNNSYYGQQGCIIFRPDDITYSENDSFTVNITANNQNISYTVNFFFIYSKGDLNCDRQININDVKIALRGALNNNALTEDQFTAADVNEDEKVNISDVKIILKAALNGGTL